MEFELDDSEEIESDEDQNQMPGQKKLAAAAGTDPQDFNEEEFNGGYNPADYAHLNVSNDVRELFEYIGRYKPQKIDLEVPLRPFIPEFIPNVGEVDAFLKMPKPEGSPETLGIEVIDEPALNTADKAVLEMKYIQLKQTTKIVEMKIHSIDNADKNSKEVMNWIKNVNDLNSSKPPASVNYTKFMPDFDKLMEEWPPAMERALKEIQFPGPDIDLSIEEYAKLIATMLDVPVHNLPDNKGIMEALHVIFTLYSDFKENIHFQKKHEGRNVDDDNAQSMAFS
jgi:intraflagellar transport protein 46